MFTSLKNFIVFLFAAFLLCSCAILDLAPPPSRVPTVKDRPFPKISWRSGVGGGRHLRVWMENLRGNI